MIHARDVLVTIGVSLIVLGLMSAIGHIDIGIGFVVTFIPTYLAVLYFVRRNK